MEVSFDGLLELIQGFARIDRNEFIGVVKATLTTDEAYAEKQWPEFTRNPIGYCLSRNPRAQGETLIELAKMKMRPPPVHLRVVR